MIVVSDCLFPRSLRVQEVFIRDWCLHLSTKFQPAVAPVRLSPLWRRRGSDQPVRRHFALTLYQDRPSLLVTEDIKNFLELTGTRALLFSRFRNQFLEIQTDAGVLRPGPGLGWLRFIELLGLIGHWSSYLLPSQEGGTSQFIVNPIEVSNHQSLTCILLSPPKCCACSGRCVFSAAPQLIPSWCYFYTTHLIK